MIVKDSAGNELLAIIDVPEESAEQQYSQVKGKEKVAVIDEALLQFWK